MKKHLLTILLCIGTIVAGNTKSNAQSTDIYYWDFNAADSATHGPSYTVPGGGTATYSYWCAYTDYAEGSAVNMQSGDYAGNCIRFRNPSDSVTFFMPTTGYTNVQFSYAEQRTNNGPHTNSVFYTVDGTHYIPTSAVDMADSATYTVDSTDATEDSVGHVGWQLQTYSFSADTMTRNNPLFAVTIVFVDGPDSASGNDRFDNIILKGAPIVTTPPSGVTPVAINPNETYTLYPNPARNNLAISASSGGNKSIVIYNELGETVFSGIKEGKTFSINTRDLSAGSYYLDIHENETGDISTMKFVKQ